MSKQPKFGLISAKANRPKLIPMFQTFLDFFLDNGRVSNHGGESSQSRRREFCNSHPGRELGILDDISTSSQRFDHVHVYF